MATELALTNYVYKRRSSTPDLNSLFTAAKTLMAAAVKAKLENAKQWKVKDHARYMFMLMNSFVVWVLGVVSSIALPSSPPPYPLLLEGRSSSSLDLILRETCTAMAIPPGQALGRALSHVLAIVNEIPAASSKYQFVVAMADKIIDENTRDGRIELLEINRLALSSAFARTSYLLHNALESSYKASDNYTTWGTRLLSSLPFGALVAPYFVKGVSTVISFANGSYKQRSNNQLVLGGRERMDDVAAEKHAQELLWIADKMRGCGAVDEALVQWSLSSSLATLALNANPRVQGLILKMTTLLIGDVKVMEEVPSEVTFRLLLLWLPLLCYGENGMAYPILSRYERAEIERVIDNLISTLPRMDQQVLLVNWLQDFTISASEWPNLQLSYHRWLNSTRDLVAEVKTCLEY